jgi:hypothetical protein
MRYCAVLGRPFRFSPVARGLAGANPRTSSLFPSCLSTPLCVCCAVRSLGGSGGGGESEIALQRQRLTARRKVLEQRLLEVCACVRVCVCEGQAGWVGGWRGRGH